MVGDINALADLSVQYLSRLSGKTVIQMQEPDFTAALSSVLPVLLNREISLSHIKFGGCFIHQKPKVKFHSSKVTGNCKGCEAGDLMILCRQIIDGEERYNAVIFQIKMHEAPFAKPHVITAHNELIQKELYSFWPAFDITNGEKTTKFDILPKTITPAAQYMMVRRTGPRTIFSTSYPDSPIELDKYENIGRCVYELVKWQTGRPITSPDEPNKDEWSKFIWEIVDISKRSVYNRKNVGISNEPRATGDFFKMLIQDSSSYNGNVQFISDRSKREFGNSFKEDEYSSLIEHLKNNQFKYYENADESIGMSILFVDVTEQNRV